MSDGLYTNEEMVDEITELLNEVSVSGVKSVVSLANAFSMLSGLKGGIKEEAKAKNKTIELLKEQLKRATEPNPEDGGDVVGGEHYDLNYGGAEHGAD